MTLDEWISERPEVRYFGVEVRENGEFEARLGTDDPNDEVPFPGARGSSVISAVAGLAALFEVGAASSGSAAPS